MLNLPLGWVQLDMLMSGAGRQFTLPEFTHTLAFILESLSDPNHQESDLTPLVRLMSVLAHGTPEGGFEYRTITPPCRI